MLDYSDLIDELVAIRKAKGMTQSDVSSASGITQSVVARIEKKKSIPTMATFCRLVNAVGAHVKVIQ